MNKIPGEGQSMTRDVKKPGGSGISTIETEIISTTFDKGGNNKPVVWENGENQAWDGEDD